MQLAHFDSAGFLADIWQKRPLLIRNPWNGWANPLDPDDLAGLACDEDIESRLIIAGRGGWKVEHGPFAESRFAKMGKAPWTLLVQAVDHAVPDVAALIEAFRFVPNWRIDDVMVSYAVTGGGVGPHFDQYDVFLIQGLGRRRWRVGPVCGVNSELIPLDDLCQLAEFTAQEEWVLEPGDILYLPPGYAHEGVAMDDDCMTYSIGFRAPARAELIAHWCDDVLGRLTDDDRYADPQLPPQANPGEITPAAIARLHEMVTAKLDDREGFARWFGQYTSTPKYPDMDWQPEAPIEVEDLRAHLGDGVPLCRNPASRFAFIRQGTDALVLFVDGQSHDCAGEVATLAEQLCAQTMLHIAPSLAACEPAMRLLARLFNQGCVAFEEETDDA